MNETKEPVIYLSPTVQLVQQTLAKAKEYSIPATPYEKGKEFSEEFLAGRSVLNCTYNALFNGCSRFAVRGNGSIMRVGGRILDDSHIAFSTVRDSFTFSVKKNKFEWPFLRDAFNYCHCLISQNSFVITPFLPPVDLIPTFSECPKRIFMSPTIGDDSAIVRTFDANFESIAKPISSNSLAGVSERMILAPELMKFSIDDIPHMLRNLAK